MIWALGGSGVLLVAIAYFAKSTKERPETAITERSIVANLEALHDPASAKREAAAKALGGAWPDIAEAVPMLVLALGDEVEAVRVAAARSLAALGERGAPVIVRALDEARRSVQARTAESVDPAGVPGLTLPQDGLLGVLHVSWSLGANILPRDVAIGLDWHGQSREGAGRGSAAALAFLPCATTNRWDGVDVAGYLLLASQAASNLDPLVRERGTASLAILGRWLARLSLARAAVPPLHLPEDARSTLVSMFTVGEHEWDELSSRAAFALAARLAVGDADVVAKIATALDGKFQRMALEAIGEMGAGVPSAKAVLAGRTDVDSLAARARLGDFEGVRRALTDLRGQLGYESERIVILALAEAGDHDDAVLDALADQLLGAGFDENGSRAAMVVGRFGTGAARVIPSLTKTAESLRKLDRSDEVVQLTLARVRPPGVDLAAAWRTHMMPPRNGERPPDARFWNAMFAETVEAAIDLQRLVELLSLLGDEPASRRIVAAACRALGKLGAKGAEAAPALAARLVRAQGTEPEVPTPLQLQEDGADGLKAFELRAPVLEALAQLGPGAKDAIPSVEQLLTSKDERIRFLAVRALRRMRG